MLCQTQLKEARRGAADAKEKPQTGCTTLAHMPHLSAVSPLQEPWTHRGMYQRQRPSSRARGGAGGRVCQGSKSPGGALGASTWSSPSGSVLGRVGL